MKLNCGFVGLPNVGKSTLFNALSNNSVAAENYPFCTIEPNVGIIEIPDERVKSLSKIFTPKKTTYNTVEFIDIAGLVKNAHQGEGLGNQFLSQIRSVKVLIQVVRFFEDKNVAHVENKINPLDDIETINTELVLSDIKIVENNLEKNEKLVKAKMPGSKLTRTVLNALLEHLNRGGFSRSFQRNSKEDVIIKSLFLLTDKPMVCVANIGENNTETNQIQEAESLAKQNRSSFIRINGKLESQITDLSQEEKHLMLNEYGLKEPGLNSLIKESHKILGLQTFFTCHKEEVRARTIARGATAIQAAEEVHTDFAKKFIKAEIYTFNDAIKYKNNIKDLKTLGLVKIVGKDYIMQEGDVAYFIKGQ